MIIIDGGEYNGEPGDIPVLVKFRDGTCERTTSLHNEAARSDARKWGEEGYFCRKTGATMRKYYPPSQIQCIEITTGYGKEGLFRKDLLEDRRAKDGEGRHS